MSLHTTLIYILSFLAFFVTSFYILSMRDYYKRRKVPLEATDKTVTIIIPAYNEEESIEKTIESALALDYPKNKFEIIVVDDGSNDKTYELAKKYVSSKDVRVRVFTKKNNGKGSALNFAIKRSKKDIIISMDADTFAEPPALKRMVAQFYHDKVMSVAPSMGVYKPKGILQRIQHIEYYLGVFLRKAFASVDAVHVTPGAFSAYRRSFFVKYGGYDEGNITEDLEIALRIQSHDYVIENAARASVYTIAPKTLRGVIIQRRRWYVGWMRNFWNYKRLFGIKKGVLGTITLPMAFISIFLSITLTIYSLIKVLGEIRKELSFLESINFEFDNIFELSQYVSKEFFVKMFYTLFTQPVFFIALFSVGMVVFYLVFSRKKMHYKEKIFFNALIFVFSYAASYSFWWLIAIVYVIFNRKIVWRGKYGKKV